MKRSWKTLVLVVGLLAFSVSAQATDWTFMSNDTAMLNSGSLWRVQVIDNQSFLAVGMHYVGIDLEPGMVFSSVDAGATVQEILAVNQWPFAPGGFCKALISVNDLQFLNMTNGLIFGAWGGSYTECTLFTSKRDWIASTSTGGGALDTWSPIALDPVAGDEIYAVAFIDENLGVAAGTPTSIWSTLNGGGAWTRLADAPSFYDDLVYVSASMVDETDIYLAGEEYPEYADDDYEYDDDLDDDLDDDFDDDRDAGKDFEDLDGIAGQLVFTNNGGLSWSTLLSSADLEDPFTDAVGFHKVQFIDDNGWLLVLNDEEHLVDLLYTIDAGATWESTTFPSVPGVGEAGDSYMIADFHFLNTTIGWAVGYSHSDQSVILKTDDGGLTWDVDDYFGEGRLLAIDFLNGRNAYAVGEDMTVLKYYKLENEAPLANAGADQEVVVGTIVDLDGTASYDPDGDTIQSWVWSQTEGPEDVTLTGSDTATPAFTVLTKGEYTFELVVSDGAASSTPDGVDITVTGGGGEDDDDTADDDTDGGLDDDADGGDDDDDDDDDGGCCG